MKKFILISLVIFFLDFGFIVSEVRAIVMPSVYVKNLSLEKNSYSVCEEIRGSFEISSGEEMTVAGLTYQVNLLGGYKNNIPTIHFDTFQSKENLTVLPGQTTGKTFVYWLPCVLPQGSYGLRTIIKTSHGEEISWQDQIIEVRSEEQEFVFLSNPAVIKDGIRHDPGGGVNFDQGEKPQITLTATKMHTNQSADEIIFTPEIKVFRREIENYFIKSYKEKEISLDSQKNEILTFDLPLLETPQVYLTEVSLLNGDGERASNVIYFRWVIKGVSAEVISISLDKTAYKAGEEAVVNINYVGPASDDIEIENPNVMLKVGLFDGNGQKIGETESLASLFGGQVQFSIPVDKSGSNVFVRTEIQKDGVSLAEYQTKDVKSQPPEIKSKFWPFVLPVIVIFVILAGFLVYRRSKKILVMLFFIFSGALIALNPASAFNVEVEVSEESGYNVGTAWQMFNPNHNQVYKPGDTINFTGYVKAGGCGNTLNNTWFTFYLTDAGGGNEVILGGQPLMVGNNVCFGPTPSMFNVNNQLPYNWWAPNTYWNPPYKVSIPHPYFCESGVEYGSNKKIEFNLNFKIPEIISLNGVARAYIYFRGQHWTAGDQHWHWARGYEHIYIENNQTPSASIGCSSPAANCTGYTPLDPITLLNQSSDPDNNITGCSWQITGPQSQSLNACSNFTPQSLQPGSYNARLTVTDAYGLSSTANKSFSMKQDIIAKFSCSEDNAAYTENCSSLDPTVNSQFWLKDLSTPSQGATVNSWQWSLTNANPSFSSLQNVITRFITQGAQTATLRATDTQGRTDTEQKTINTRTFIPKFKEVAP